MSIFTYIVYLHARQTDSASDKCFMDYIQAESVEDAEEAVLSRHEADDPEIITLIEGKHADAR